MVRHASISIVIVAVFAAPAIAQDGVRVYVGGLFGVSTLSADARALATPDMASASSYKPENGPALNLFAGAHLARYVTLQANYIFNANDLSLFASTTAPDGGAFYEQMRESAQHTFVADVLVYFRARGQKVRPYLGTGLAIVRFDSPDAAPGVVSGISPPTGSISATQIALRSHVGIDLSLGSGWSFRYSFSETIGPNPVSRHLMPAGRRGLANFQNLFGVLRHF